jgi:hypothetical protein
MSFKVSKQYYLTHTLLIDFFDSILHVLEVQKGGD